MSVSSILGSAEKQAAQSTTSKTAEDKDMFLKLLVAQLQYQDPLNPQEDTEFIAQLAQFTQVEEMQKMNTNFETMLGLEEQRTFADAINMVGAAVIGVGNVVRKGQGQVPVYDENGELEKDEEGNQVYEEGPVADPFYYRSDYDVVDVSLTIRNSNGVEVYTTQLPAMEAGKTYTYLWDTMDNYKNEAADGYYQAYITAKDSSGNSQLVTTEVSGKVVSLENIGGEYILHMEDGRQVKYLEVGWVGIPSS
ncbi:flagellar hook assembly protein FlgD [Desulfovibrio sp. OttesenSCG-928-C06]|nr:flagellar hook assembly protein FlgD [Desulfovibrio sp. OttesenSCG-928-C06]